MGTPYEKLYNRALRYITDPTLVQLPEEDMEDMLYGWLMDAIAEPVIGEYDFSDRDDELKQFNFDISNTDQKIIAIPFGDPQNSNYTDISELPKHIFDELIHFLTVYKQLENKPVKIESISGRRVAVETVEECIKLFEETFEKSE